MLTIKVKIDKQINELTKKELIALDWDSVNEVDFIKLTDEQIPYCPGSEVMDFYYLTELNPSLITHTFISKVKSAAKRHEIPFTLMRFINERIAEDENMVPYFPIIIETVERYNCSAPLNKLVKTLIRQNMCSINDLNVCFENIIDDELLYYYCVSADEWFEFCNTTNFIHFIKENYGKMLDVFCLPIYNEQLTKLGFFKIPDFDMKNVSSIYKSPTIERIITTRYSDSLIPWDVLVKSYHDREISCDVLKYSWDYAMNEYEHLLDTDFYKKGYPLNWSKDDMNG